MGSAAWGLLIFHLRARFKPIARCNAMRVNPNALAIINLSAFIRFNIGKNRFFSQSFDAGKAYCLSRKA